MKRSLKEQARLAARIKDWAETVERLSKGNSDRSKGYYKPGSNRK